MPIALSDVRAVLLPTEFVRGLNRMTSRVLEISDSQGQYVTRSLFGNEPAFGGLVRVNVEDVISACTATSADSSASAVRDFVDVLKRVHPHTPVCTLCGDMPLSVIAGKISELPVNSACPFCTKGHVTLIPMKLKKLSWTDGRLVEPQVSLDLRSRPGERIPLDDEGILSWSGGWMHSSLERALKETDVPLYALLAYTQLARKLFRSLDDAVTLLQKPEVFGLKTRERILEVLHQAGAFVAQREVTNLPSAQILAFRLGRKTEALESITIAGRSYLLEGKVGDGDKSTVFRGIWEHLPTERVIIKICHALEDSDLVKREALMLKTLASGSMKGAEHLSRFVPQLITYGRVTDTNGMQRPVIISRDNNHYDWTLSDVLVEYPEGVDPQTMVWMWNRLLTILGVIHANGIIHGAVIPGHVLLHPMNHAAMLLDWSYAVRFGKKSDSPLQVISALNEAYYPEDVYSKQPASPHIDIAMSARSMIAVLGGDPERGNMPRSVPEQITDILRVHARYDTNIEDRVFSDAFLLRDHFKKVVEGLYGPRRYHPFELPRRAR